MAVHPFCWPRWLPAVITRCS